MCQSSISHLDLHLWTGGSDSIPRGSCFPIPSAVRYRRHKGQLGVNSGCAGQAAARQVNPNKRPPELEQTYLAIRHPLDNVFAYSVIVLRSSAANAAADCAVSAEYFHARIWPNNATRLSGIDWLWSAKRA